MEKAGDILKRIFSEKIQPSLTDELKVSGGLFNCWEEIAGDPVAAHSKIQDVDQKCLVIEADHPGWIQQIMLRQKIILRRIKERFPQLNIKRIRVRTKL